MKWLTRSFVFALAILVGITAASIASMLYLPLDVPDLNGPVSSFSEEHDERSASPKEVYVTYAGWETRTQLDEPYLKFVIHNGLSHPVAYSAHSPEGPFPSLRSNGKELPRVLRCGTGIQSFDILPGTSAEVHVYRHEFLKRPRKGDSVSAGFYLRAAVTDEYEVYYSEPFSLPEEFRQSIPRSDF